MDLVDFFPKYPNIDKNEINVLNPYDDKGFYQTIYSKKEFNELKLDKFEEVPKEQGELFKRQKIITRFLSDKTLYNSLLLYHHMGTGKCVLPKTLVTINGKNIKINRVWEKYYNDQSVIFKHGGFWVKPNQELQTLSYKIKNKIMVNSVVKYLYREYIDSEIVNITLESTENLQKTFQHKIYTKRGWKKTITIKDYVLTINGWKKVELVTYSKYRGWVYDLEVKKHNYIANSIVTHNTCSAYGTTELIREDPNSTFKGVLTLARGNDIINNLKNELVFRCSKKGKYLPENYENLTEMEKTIRITKKLQKYYSFNTFITFARELSKLPNDKITKLYSNHIIIIDEVHNIRKAEETAKNKKEDIKFKYDQIFRFLHLIQGSKILLLTGTPMRDSPDEIAPLLNLILPMNKQMPIEKNFIITFFKRKGDYLYVKKDMIPVLKDYFKGIISYLSSTENIPRKYIGNKILDNIKTFTLDEGIMSKYQTKYYEEALSKDKLEKGIYSNTRQAILMVYPDGKYGKEGFVTVNQRKTMIRGKGVEYILPSNISDKFTQGLDDSEKIKILSIYSQKYAKVISYILSNKDRNGFVYCNIVEGSGLIIFSLLLKKFGFVSATGKESNPGKRYGLLTGKTTSKTIQNIIKRYNDSDNYKGDYIQILLGSRITGEGFTFKNVRDIYILTPFWNYAETSQAISRGIREGSHTDLIEKNIDPDIRIYQLISLPYNNGESLDLEMYKVSAKKDVSIKSIDRVIKESAIDCQLTYNLNYKPQLGNTSRECDYQKCEYTCNGITDKNPEIDYSTYNLYYSQEESSEFSDKILNDFKVEFDKIINGNFIEIKTLRNIIEYNNIIYNKYGFISFLREENNKYFLVDNPYTFLKEFTEYYNKYPIVKEDVTESDIISQLMISRIPAIFEILLKEYKNDERFKELIKNFPIIIQEYILEGSILANRLKITDNIKFTNKIEKYYSSYLTNIDNQLVSSLLIDTNNILRCLKDNSWYTCDTDILDKFKNKKVQVREDLTKNIYGYYGIFNAVKNKFWIRDVTTPQKVEDNRRINTGKMCSTWYIKDLLKIIYSIPISYPNIFTKFGKKYDINSLSISDIKELTLNNKNSKQLVELIPTMSKDQLFKVFYWAEQPKSNICKALKEWFKDNNLLMEGDPGKKE